MPFGLTNAPTTFMGLMNIVFKGYLYQFVIIFIDDILIYSQSTKEWEDHFRIALMTLRNKKLYVKFSKCEFCLKKITLEHVVSIKKNFCGPGKSWNSGEMVQVK